jgi:AcrR family transcriptional regulator
MGERLPSERRRRLLLDAGQRALVESGPHSLRLKDVASAAEVTPSAILYHYPNFDDLVRDIYEEATDRWHRQREAQVREEADPVVRLRTMIASGMPESPDDASVRLLCELEGQSVRNADYARLMQDLFDRQVALYEEILDDGVRSGVFAPTAPALTVARALVALEDSLSYYILNEHPELDHTACVGIVTATASALIGIALAGAPSAAAG